MNTDQRREFASVAQAAEKFGVSAPTIYAWIRRGSLKAIQPGGPSGSLRIARAELDRLAEGDRR